MDNSYFILTWIALNVWNPKGVLKNLKYAQWLILANIGQKVKIACTIFVCEPTTKLMVPKERLSLKYLL